MKHAREDYQRIQDPAGLIPADEPVFLLRGQDACAPEALRYYAKTVHQMGGDPRIAQAAREQARQMDIWQRDRAEKLPDMPEDAT